MRSWSADDTVLLGYIRIGDMKVDMQEIEIVSSLDGTKQPSLLWVPESPKTPVPLVVGLHSWSRDRFNQEKKLLPFCQERGWALLLPEFRGPNLRSNPHASQGCGSIIARQDIVDATRFVTEHYCIEPSQRLLIGFSGGGHMALLVAAYAPELWRAVETWCPVTDLREWHAGYGQGVSYADTLEYCLGGTPDASPEIAEAYRLRSPISYLKELAGVNLSIHHGRFDHVVPYKITYRFAQLLQELEPENFFFEVFDGAHETCNPHSFEWFEKVLGKNSGLRETITS